MGPWVFGTDQTYFMGSNQSILLFSKRNVLLLVVWAAGYQNLRFEVLHHYEVWIQDFYQGGVFRPKDKR